jgi:hypothetical protein
MESPLRMLCLACFRPGRVGTTTAPGRRSIAPCLWALVVGLSLAGLVQAQEKSPDRNVITQEDLIRLSKEKVGDALIVELVKAADELPNLTPQDVIELRQTGVSANVLTAVIQRRNTTVAAKPEIAGQPKRRRIRVAAVLEPQRRAIWNRIQEKDKVEEIQVSWGLQADSWDDRSPLDLKASPNCPQESFCRSRDAESGRCLEEVEAGSSAWKERFGCYADAKLTKFGAEYQVFEVDLPETAADASIVAFFREGADLVPWFTRGAENSNGDRVPGQVRLQLFGSNDFDLDLQVKLLMSPGGFVQDLQVGQCQVVNRDDASMERRILSQNRQYCHLEEARF